MIDQTLDLCFKADRDYLHGTDMYNSVMKIAAARNTAITGHRLAIHAFAHTQCRLTLFEAGETATQPAGRVADVAFDAASGKITGFLTETAAAVTCRYPYDEERISALCDVDGAKIRIDGASGYSAIEVMVTMTKHLHNIALPQPSGKWVFTKLELSRTLSADDATRFEIVLLHNFNNRLTKSRVVSGNDAIGHVYFSLWQP